MCKDFLKIPEQLSEKLTAAIEMTEGFGNE